MYKSKLTAFWLCVGVASAADTINASMDGGWLTEAASQVLTPKSDRVAPVCVMKQDVERVSPTYGHLMVPAV